jgi:hypothetical protein
MKAVAAFIITGDNHCKRRSETVLIGLLSALVSRACCVQGQRCLGLYDLAESQFLVL